MSGAGARALALSALALALSAGEARAQVDTARATRDTAHRSEHVTRQRRDTVAMTVDSIPQKHSIRVCAGGDVTLGTNLDPAWQRRAGQNLRRAWRLSAEPDSLIAPLAPLLADADVVLLNVEGAIGRGPAASKCGPRSKNCFAFRMPPAAATAMRGVAPGATVVGNLANNHARDAGAEGVDSTVAHLERAGVLVTGIDSMATLVPTPRGDTIAILGFYTNGDTTSTTPDARDLAGVRRHVARAVERWGTVIATVHIGAEGTRAQRTRNATEPFLGIDRGNPVAFADSAIAGGAALVVGHGPHVMRAAEWRGDRLVLYSLGNLLTYGPFTMREPLNRGAVACVDLEGARVAGAELRSTVQLAAGVLQADRTRRAAFLVDSLGRLDFRRTGARVDSLGRLVVPRAEAGVDTLGRREAPHRDARVDSLARRMPPRADARTKPLKGRVAPRTDARGATTRTIASPAPRTGGKR